MCRMKEVFSASSASAGSIITEKIGMCLVEHFDKADHFGVEWKALHKVHLHDVGHRLR